MLMSCYSDNTSASLSGDKDKAVGCTLCSDSASVQDMYVLNETIYNGYGLLTQKTKSYSDLSVSQGRTTENSDDCRNITGNAGTYTLEANDNHDKFNRSTSKLRNIQAYKKKDVKGKKTTNYTSKKKTSKNIKEMDIQPKVDRYMALKTNVAYDVIGVPNLSFEIQCCKHVTVDIPVMMSFWDFSRKHAVRTVAFQPEVRWWISTPGKGHFLGVHTHVAWFNVKWNDERYQAKHRPLFGAGLGYGYVLPVSKHWTTEFSLGIGYADIGSQVYYNIDNGALKRKDRKNYWGITKLGISFSYRF